TTYVCVCFFFFSSRRRHTRCLSDWSSDVCSSDLLSHVTAVAGFHDCGAPDVGAKHRRDLGRVQRRARRDAGTAAIPRPRSHRRRSEEHTSELQSLRHIVCRLLLEKKKKKNNIYND